MVLPENVAFGDLELRQPSRSSLFGPFVGQYYLQPSSARTLLYETFCLLSYSTLRSSHSDMGSLERGDYGLKIAFGRFPSCLGLLLTLLAILALVNTSSAADITIENPNFGFEVIST